MNKILGSVLLATLTFHWVEEPSRKWSRRFFVTDGPKRNRGGAGLTGPR